MQAYSDNGAAPAPTSANELPFQSTQSIDESQMLPTQQLPMMGGSGSSMDEEDFNEHFIYLGAPKVNRTPITFPLLESALRPLQLRIQCLKVASSLLPHSHIESFCPALPNEDRSAP